MPLVVIHQGGWDEILMFFVAPTAIFVFLRWLGIRKERREAEDPALTDGEE